MEELLRFLNSIHPLPPLLQEHLFSIIKFKSLRKGDYILKPAQISRNIFFIQKGLLRAYYLKHDEEVSAWFMKEGGIVVSILSFYDQIPTFEFIQALEDSEVFYIDYDELNDIYNQHLEFNFIGRVLTIDYLKMWAWQLFSIRMQSALERYQWLVDNNPEIVLRVPAKHIASYLDITEVTLSRIKNRLSKGRKYRSGSY